MLSSNNIQRNPMPTRSSMPPRTSSFYRMNSKFDPSQFSDNKIFKYLSNPKYHSLDLLNLVTKELEKFTKESKISVLYTHDYQDNYTPVMWAAKYGFDDVLLYFLKVGYGYLNLDKKGGWNDSTALMKAAESNHKNSVEILCDHGADLNVQNDFKSTALMLAAERGHIDVVRYLIGKKAEVDVCNELEYTALILAAEKGHAEVVQLLCEADADLDFGNKFGKTALIMASEFNQIECVRVLLEAGAHVNHKSKRGMTALMLATVKGNKEIVLMLLDNKADVNLADQDGNSAIVFSMVPNDVSILECLLARGAHTGHRNKLKHTPFMRAALLGKLDKLRILMANKDIFLLKSECRQKSTDGSTALHLAASNGHIGVLLCLVDECGGNLKWTNDNGQMVSQVLGKFYMNNEHKFSDFVLHAVKKCELFEMLTVLLPHFKSPNSVLNDCFSQLLHSIRGADDVDIVISLVHLAVGLNLAIMRHPLESVDLRERLDTVHKMLLSCMSANGLDSEENVQLVLEDRKIRDNDTLPYKVHGARVFIEKTSPLKLCLKYDILSILGTRQLSIFVDRIFAESLRTKSYRPMTTWRGAFQMRSNYVNWRTNPSANFYFEGCSKFVMLCLVTTILLDQSMYTLHESSRQNLTANEFNSVSNTLVIMVGASILREIGEFHGVNWKIRAYFGEPWNFFDVASLGLVLCWVILTWHGNYEHDYSFPTIPDDVLVGEVTDLMIPHPIGKAFLAVSAVPMSIGLLRYISTNRSIGQYVLMVIKMIFELRIFVLVFIFCTLGFAIALHGLFPYLDDFRTVQRTVLVLFYSSLGQMNNTYFFEGDPFETTGVILYALYVGLSLIVLLNIIIATFSAIHDRTKERAVEGWCYMKARNVQQFLLIREKNPLCMIPAPLNIIPTIFLPFHYLVILFSTFEYDKFMEKLFGKKHEKRHPTLRRQTSVLANISQRQLFKQLIYDKSAEEENRHLFLSLSGTISDMTIGIMGLLPCALYEIFLCLKEIKSRQISKFLFWKVLLFTIVFFPFVYLAFVITLAIEVLKIRTILIYTDEKEIEVYYPPDEKRSETTPKPILDEDKYYTCLNVKIIRAEIKPTSCFFGSKLTSKYNVRAELRIGSQVLVTPVKESTDLKPLWDITHDFYLCFDDDELKDRLVKIAIYDDRLCLGRCDASFSRWVANGRFEGNLDMIDNNGTVMGTITITAQTKFLPRKPITPMISPKVNDNDSSADVSSEDEEDEDADKGDVLSNNVANDADKKPKILQIEEGHSVDGSTKIDPSQDDEIIRIDSSTLPLIFSDSKRFGQEELKNSNDDRIHGITNKQLSDALKHSSDSSRSFDFALLSIHILRGVCEPTNTHSNSKSIRLNSNIEASERYLEIQIGDELRRTKALVPIDTEYDWNEFIDFKLNSTSEVSLQNQNLIANIRLYESKFSSSNEAIDSQIYLGGCEMSIAEWIKEESAERSLELYGSGGVICEVDLFVAVSWQKYKRPLPRKLTSILSRSASGEKPLTKPKKSISFRVNTVAPDPIVSPSLRNRLPFQTRNLSIDVVSSDSGVVSSPLSRSSLLTPKDVIPTPKRGLERNKTFSGSDRGLTARSKMVRRGQIFTEEDRQRIFHGVEEKDSYFTRNPFAYELYTELKHQESRYFEKKYQMLQEKYEDIDEKYHLIQDKIQLLLDLHQKGDAGNEQTTPNQIDFI